MNFNKHLEIKGLHALFSPSQGSWLNYSDDKIRDRVKNQYRKALGTEIHEYAAQQITLNHKVTNIRSVVSGIENYIYTKYRIADESKPSSFGNCLLQSVGSLPKEVFEMARLYINDGIAFRMTAEQPLVYSDYVFGTADTISFRDNLLRISDYKSGDHPASMDQLITYAALFCLEYTVKPRDIKTELRLYQAGEITLEEPESEDLEDTMATIINVTKVAERYKAKEG